MPNQSKKMVVREHLKVFWLCKDDPTRIFESYIEEADRRTKKK